MLMFVAEKAPNWLSVIDNKFGKILWINPKTPLAAVKIQLAEILKHPLVLK